MNIQTHKLNGTTIAEIISEEIVVQNMDDALDLLGNLYYQGFDEIILYEKNITPDFFTLKNGIAGAILQKFSQYRMKLAIVGDFSKMTSKSMADFIYESNKGNQIHFVTTVNQALNNSIG